MISSLISSYNSANADCIVHGILYSSLRNLKLTNPCVYSGFIKSDIGHSSILGSPDNVTSNYLSSKASDPIMNLDEVPELPK